MPGLVLVLITLLLVLIIFYANRKNIAGNARKRWMIWAGIIVFPATLFWVGYESSVLSFNMETRSWTPTPGSVVNSQVSGDRAVHPAITIRYEAGGVERSFTTDLFAPGFGVRSNRRDQAEKLVAAYPAGDTVTVHVNPENPLQARIHPGPTWNNYMRVGLALIFAGTGFWLILVYLGSRPEKELSQQ